jgi:hypothetical protein
MVPEVLNDYSFSPLLLFLILVFNTCFSALEGVSQGNQALCLPFSVLSDPIYQ